MAETEKAKADRLQKRREKQRIKREREATRLERPLSAPGTRRSTTRTPCRSWASVPGSTARAAAAAASGRRSRRPSPPLRPPCPARSLRAPGRPAAAASTTCSTTPRPVSVTVCTGPGFGAAGPAGPGREGGEDEGLSAPAGSGRARRGRSPPERTRPGCHRPRGRAGRAGRAPRVRGRDRRASPVSRRAGAEATTIGDAGPDAARPSALAAGVRMATQPSGSWSALPGRAL